MRHVAVLLFAIGGCAAWPRHSGDASGCPEGTTPSVEATVEGNDTWWACRDDARRPEGPSRMTYADGRPRNTGTYHHGVMDGRWVYFDREGGVEAEGTWHMGEREGRWVWKDSVGIRVEDYRAGKEEGRFTRKGADGTLREEGDYAAGEKVGLWRAWDEHGQLLLEQHFLAGIEQGTRRTFYPNGQLTSATEYAAGAPIGHVVTFYENGTKESEGDWLEGRPSGHWLYWGADGKIVSEGEMRDGKREGDWVIEGRRVHFEDDREGTLRPCPPGSVARIECAARCCDRTARWCERPDGTKVGPFDLWDVGGKLIESSVSDPR